MMKRILVGLLALMALSACSFNQVPDPNPQPDHRATLAPTNMPIFCDPISPLPPGFNCVNLEVNVVRAAADGVHFDDVLRMVSVRVFGTDVHGVQTMHMETDPAQDKIPASHVTVAIFYDADTVQIHATVMLIDQGLNDYAIVVVTSRDGTKTYARRIIDQLGTGKGRQVSFDFVAPK